MCPQFEAVDTCLYLVGEETALEAVEGLFKTKDRVPRGANGIALGPSVVDLLQGDAFAHVFLSEQEQTPKVSENHCCSK